MDDRSKIHLGHQTLVAKALGALEPSTNGLVPAIHMATTFARESDGNYRPGHVYGRADSLSVHQAENVIAALESADEAMLFVSGMAAAAAVIMSLPPQSHIVASDMMYWGLRKWLQSVGRFGHSITFADTSDLNAVAAAMKPGMTKLVWIETPSNPLWTVTDIAAVCEIAHAIDADVCVDSTIPTPIFTQPLLLGADMVMHSATKYLNGHSDIVAGALATVQRSDLWERVRALREELGTALGSFEAWLLVRGMRTLDVRVRTQARSAQIIAERLLDRPEIEAVLYAGLPSHPGHRTALRQMQGGFGGMLSIRLADEVTAKRVARRTRLWKHATSFGGIESLIEHRASIEGEGTSCPRDLLRLSVGLEDVEDLYADLCTALSGSSAEDL